MPELVMLSSMVPDFYAGFWSCGTGPVTDWLSDFSSEIRKTEANFTSKQGVFTFHVRLRGKVPGISIKTQHFLQSVKQ